MTVFQSRGAWFREQSKFFESGNLFVIYLDELSIYKWTELWNIKGRFPESWGLRASVSSSPLPLPLPFFLLPLQLSRYTSTGNACYAGYHYGRREGERRKGGRGRGEKIRLPDIIVLLENSVRCQTELLIWCGIGKQIDACQLTVTLYCLFRFCQSFGIGAAGNVACITAMRKSKLFLHWSSGFAHSTMLLVPMFFFFGE